MDRLSLSDEDTEDLWNSPSQRGKKKLNHPSIKQESSPPAPQSDRVEETLFDRQEAREAALRNELQTVRNINQVIESLLGSLDRAKGNMENVSRTVNSASTLLNTWTRILSQTEHNQRVILNPNWQGASQDVADMENEELLKQQAAERRERELEQRREAAVRKAEEDERKRALSTGTRGTRVVSRGRVRSGLGRTPSVSYSGTSTSGTRTTSTTSGTKSSTTGTRRPVSGIARGPGVTRGRGRA
ncbi:DASH complex subunit Duo1-domain-containing protein [Aspergillus spectabilis]